MGQIRQTVRPEAPHGPQEAGEGAEKEHRAAQRPQHHEAPQNPVPPPQEEEEGHGAHAEAVEPVQQGGTAGQAQAEGAQEVVQHGGGHAQQDGLAEGRQLQGERGAHHPKRRLRNPPRPCPSSS